MPIVSNHIIRSQLILDKLKSFDADEGAAIETYEQIETLLKGSDAATHDAKNLIEELNILRKQLIADRGLTRDTAEMAVSVAGESLLSRTVRSTLTDYPSRPDLVMETVVACESISQRLKITIIIAIVGVILKILGWLLGRESNKRNEYVAGKMDDVIKSKVDALNEVDKEVVKIISSPHGQFTYLKIRERLEKNRPLSEIELDHLFKNLHEIDEMASATKLVQRPGVTKEPSTLDYLLERGIDCYERVFEQYEKGSSNEMLDRDIDPQELTRALLKQIILTNVGTTILPGTKEIGQKTVSEIAYEWYRQNAGTSISLGDTSSSLWSVTGCRMFCSDAFKGYTDPKFESALMSLQVTIHNVGNKLAEFNRIYKRNPNAHFLDAGLFDPEILSHKVLVGFQRTPFTLEDSSYSFTDVPPHSAPTQEIGAPDFTTLKNAPMQWANTYLLANGISYAHFTPGAWRHTQFDPNAREINAHWRDTAMSLYSSAIDLNRTEQLTMLDMLTFTTIGSYDRKQIHRVFEHNHDIIQHDILVELAGMEQSVTLEEFHGLENGSQSASSLIIPRTSALLGANAADAVDRLTQADVFDTLTFFRFFALSVTHGKRYMDGFDPNKYRRQYARIKQSIEDVRKEMIQIERATPNNTYAKSALGSGLAKRHDRPTGGDVTWGTLNAIIRNYYYKDSRKLQNYDDHMDDSYDGGYMESGFMDCWLYIQNLLKFSENISKVAAGAKAIAERANQSPFAPK